MKMSDLRAKARAIFGPAIAEPMPNMPNGGLSFATDGSLKMLRSNRDAARLPDE